MDAATGEVVRERAGTLCEYCHLPQGFSGLRFHIEHIVPRQHGGTDDTSNLALACPECNFRKGTNLTGIDPDTRQVTPLFHPRRDRWNDHFALVDGSIGRTNLGWTHNRSATGDEHRRPPAIAARTHPAGIVRLTPSAGMRVVNLGRDQSILRGDDAPAGGGGASPCAESPPAVTTDPVTNGEQQRNNDNYEFVKKSISAKLAP
jgi:hypothetical protein